MVLAVLGFSSRYFARASPTAELTMPSTSLLPSLVLVWPSNCGCGHAERDDGGQALAEVVAAGHEVLEHVLLLAVVVERAGQGRAEAGDVRAAFDGVDVVDVGVDVLGVLGRVLHGDFVADALVLAGDVDHVGVERLAGAVQVLDELDDAPLVVELSPSLIALVAEDDPHAAVEEGQFLQAACTGCCS